MIKYECIKAHLFYAWIFLNGIRYFCSCPKDSGMESIMAKKKDSGSSYSMAVRVTCIALAALTLIGTITLLIYMLAL